MATSDSDDSSEYTPIKKRVQKPGRPACATLTSHDMPRGRCATSPLPGYSSYKPIRGRGARNSLRDIQSWSSFGKKRSGC